jgi:formylglycine-generating enzyme required for sulfatase activity
MAAAPDPSVARVEWRAGRVLPGVPEAIDALAPADPLPEPPRSGWEETLRLAVAMAQNPGQLLQALQAENLALTGRIACELRRRAPSIESILPPLRQALIERSRDPEADLRHRLDCGRALGELGDPRLTRHEGPFGDFLMPPMVDVAGGRYPIGAEPADDPNYAGELDLPDSDPVHHVRIAPFALGRFPITNAEWRCFLEAGGYEDERWWSTSAARDWRLGRGTTYGHRASMRNTVARFRDHPERIDDYQQAGTYTDEVADLWRRRVAMSATELEAHLDEIHPETRLTEPRWWRHERGNHPSQPVAAISWYEAAAYCAWLAAQSGIPFRLPTEVEWEAAARGPEGRRYSFGNRYVPLSANTVVSDWDVSTRRHPAGHHGPGGQRCHVDLERLQRASRTRPVRLSLHRHGRARGGGPGSRSAAHRSRRWLEPCRERLPGGRPAPCVALTAHLRDRGARRHVGVGATSIGLATVGGRAGRRTWPGAHRRRCRL